MDTIDGMRTFVTVVSEGSFSGAAEHLVMSPQLVSKYVGQLETRLKVRLLNRSTRTLSQIRLAPNIRRKVSSLLVDRQSLVTIFCFRIQRGIVPSFLRVHR